MPPFQLFSRTDLDTLPWPDSEDGAYAASYLAPFLKNGAQPYIRNIHQTEMLVALAGGCIFPLTLTRYHPHNAYTVSPYNHYISYGGSEEVHRLKNPPIEKVIQLLLLPIAAYFQASRFDQVVYVNNWLLSTNLYPRLDEPAVAALAEHLPHLFPDRAIVFRSVDPYRNPLLFNSLQSRGFKMVLSRQVWYMDPQHALHTRQVKEDQRVLRRIKRPLGAQHIQEVGLSFRVELHRQRHSLPVIGHRFVQRLPMPLFLDIGHQRTLHIAQRGQHGLLIIEQSLLLDLVLNLDVRANRTGMKDGPRHGRSERIKAMIPIDQ